LTGARISPVKNYDSGPYSVGQELLLHVGVKQVRVTFVSLGPRVGKAVGEDTVTHNPKTAIVRDACGDLLTVKLADLKPATPKEGSG